MSGDPTEISVEGWARTKVTEYETPDDLLIARLFAAAERKLKASRLEYDLAGRPKAPPAPTETELDPAMTKAVVEYTYDLHLGWLNFKKLPPIYTTGHLWWKKTWMTKGDKSGFEVLPAIFPDQMLKDDSFKNTLSPLPSGTRAYTNDMEVVIVP